MIYDGGYKDYANQTKVLLYMSKCSDMCMEVKLTALLGNRGRQTNRQTNMRAHREISLPIR